MFFTVSEDSRLIIMKTIDLFLANGLLSIFEQARVDADQDVTVQIDIFLENQRQDEEQFLGHFDPNDNQAVYQAIQLQVCSSISSNEKDVYGSSALFRC